jgi:hypothetical protein
MTMAVLLLHATAATAAAAGGGAAAALLPAPMVASPPSTLLQPGTTTLPLTVTTSQATSCRWSPRDVPYSSMQHEFSGAPGTHHSTLLTGLSGALDVSVFFVRCQAYPTDSLTLVYRSLPDVKAAPFPRLGNLWGNYNFRGHPEGLAYAARRASLWLGSDWTAAEIAQLREANPFTIVLTSINACETNRQDLPDAFYLTNTTRPAATKGRLQSWPGAWRLDLTNPAVQQMQAQLMYALVLYGGHEGHPVNSSTPASIPFDGIFVDNVFMDNGQYVNAQDIFHNPFYPSTITPGVADDPAAFAERWRSGMVAELDRFRELMPNALMDGHISVTALRQDSNISGMFNAVSIGFTTPEIMEGRRTFTEGMKQYQDWMEIPTREPHITMVESAVRLQLGYGYGFGKNLTGPIPSACENSNSVQGAPPPAIGDACAHPLPGYTQGFLKPQTYLFARSEYQYMRFGLGYTLMLDGFYTHEMGDSWHGMDWDFDELHFSLGQSRGRATRVNVSGPVTPAPAPVAVGQRWSLYISKADGGNATWSLDPSNKPPSATASSVLMRVSRSATHAEGIELHTSNLNFSVGSYTLRFWAKTSASSTQQLDVNTLLNVPPWSTLGLHSSFTLTASWAQYSAVFDCPTNTPVGKLSFLFGKVAAGTTVWLSSPTLTGTLPIPPVMRRDFDCGTILLNGDIKRHTVNFDAHEGLYRLKGVQAPRHQYSVDDNSTHFTAQAGEWTVQSFDSGYMMKNYAQEQVRPMAGFSHHWEVGAHRASTMDGAATAVFDLAIPEPGSYDLKLWWPDSEPEIRSSWSSSMAITVLSSVGDDAGTSESVAPLASKLINLGTVGGDEWVTVASGVQLDHGARLQVECPQHSGDCLADAVLVESAARWNDGSMARSVTLQPMDAIVLAKPNTNCTLV